MCFNHDIFFLQDFYNWPDESFDEMDSTLAVQQVMIIVSFAAPIT